MSAIATVVIPARDSEGTIGACVAAVKDQTDGEGRGVRVIVVDDGSVDGTGRAAAEAGAEVLRAGGDGPARARNLGVKAADTELIVFTDADCEPLPGFVAALLAPFADPAVAGAKGAYETKQRSLTARFVQQEYEERYRRMALRESIDFIDTYAAAYRRAVLDEVGGFDERYRLPSTEDQELSFRIVEKGHRLVFVPGARVGHLHADSPWGYARKKFKIGKFKVATIRRHPGKAVSDSHTPATLKLQILLVPLVVLGAAVALAGLGMGFAAQRSGEPIPSFAFTSAYGWAPLALFLVSGAGLWIYALRDLLLAPFVPVFLFIRAAALGLGVFRGLLGELGGGVLPDAEPAKP